MAETLLEMQKRKRKNPKSWTKADQKKLLQRQIDRRKSKPTAPKPLNLYQRQLDKMKRLKTEAAAKKRKDTGPQTKTPTIIKSKQLSASDKRKIATEKRDAQSRLKLQQQIKDLKRKGQDVKARKASEKLQDIPPVSKPKKKVPSGDKPGMRIGSQVGKSKSAVKGRVDKTAVAPSKVQAKPKPVSKVVPKKVVKPVSKKVVKPKTKDMSVWETIKKGWKNLQTDPRSRSQQVQQSKGAALNKKMKEAPAYVKRMDEYKQIGDMLKARQAKPTGKDIASGRKAEADRKAAKLKRQATLEAKAGPLRPDVISKSKPTAKRVGPLRADPAITKKKPVVPIGVPKRKPISPSVNGSKVKSKSVDRFAHLKNKKVQPTTYQKPSAKMTGKLAEKHEGDPHLIRKPKAETKTIAKTPKKSKKTLGFRKISGPDDWSGGIREYETPFGNITVDSSQENLTDEQKERKKLGLTYKKGGQIKVPKKKKVGKKKQGYKARKDESIAMRVKKKRTKKQLKASRSDSYGKWGKGKGKGKINRSGAALVAASYD